MEPAVTPPGSHEELPVAAQLDDTTLQKMLVAVQTNEGGLLEDLFKRLPDMPHGAIYAAIEAEWLYADQTRALLTEPKKVQIWSSRRIAALAALPPVRTDASNEVRLRIGGRFTWEGQTWKIINVSGDQLSAVSDSLGGTAWRPTIETVLEEIRTGRLRGFPSEMPSLEDH